MRSDSRLSRMLHVLLHMARHDQPFTSAQIATMLDSNPVVVRRTMAGLREAGYVRSEKGHGGGWTIACDLRKTTLLDIHKAVGGLRIFAIGNERENPDCAVERVVNAALNDAFRQAELLLNAELGTISLADLARDFDALCKKHAGSATGTPVRSAIGRKARRPASS
jgi:DNA-binding IscR family transcriptional regulator